MLLISQSSIIACFGYFGTNSSPSEKARRKGKGTKVCTVHGKDKPVSSPFRKEILAQPLSDTPRATTHWEP